MKPSAVLEQKMEYLDEKIRRTKEQANETVMRLQERRDRISEQLTDALAAEQSYGG